MFSFLKIAINPTRIYGLDILRAFAILFVVFGHGRDLYPDSIASVTNIFTFDGVSIFFVLSGFLIGSILIKSLENNVVNVSLLFNFWIRRWMRTLPNYFLILIIIVTLNTLFSSDFRAWEIRSLFYFSQNLFSHDIYFFPEAWSLSVEEWFYLLIPLAIFLFVWLFKIPPKRAVLGVSILTLLLITLLRVYRFYDIPHSLGIDYWDLAYRKQVFMRLDTIMYGVIGSYIYSYFNLLWLKYKRFLFAVGLGIILLHQCIAVFQWHDFGIYFCVFSFSLNAFGTLLLLPLLSTLKTGRGRVYKSLTYISLISYSMYLINLTLVKFWIVQRIPWDLLSDNQTFVSIFKSCAFWGITIVVSILLYKFVEIPMMKIRDTRFIRKLLPVKVQRD